MKDQEQKRGDDDFKWFCITLMVLFISLMTAMTLQECGKQQDQQTQQQSHERPRH